MAGGHAGAVWGVCVSYQRARVSAGRMAALCRQVVFLFSKAEEPNPLAPHDWLVCAE